MATRSDELHGPYRIPAQRPSPGWSGGAGRALGAGSSSDGVLDHRDHPGLHEAGGAHDLAGAGDLGDLDHAPPGRGLDPAPGAGGHDLVGAGLSPAQLHDDFDPVTLHGRHDPPIAAASARRVLAMLDTMATARIATITPSDAAVGMCHQCDTAILIPTNTRIAPSACDR